MDDPKPLEQRIDCMHVRLGLKKENGRGKEPPPGRLDMDNKT